MSSLYADLGGGCLTEMGLRAVLNFDRFDGLLIMLYIDYKWIFLSSQEYPFPSVVHYNSAEMRILVVLCLPEVPFNKPATADVKGAPFWNLCAALWNTAS